MKIPPIETFEIPCDFLGFDVTVMCCPREGVPRHFASRGFKGHEPPPEEASGAVDGSFVWFNPETEHQDFADALSTVSHECLHEAFFLFRNRMRAMPDTMPEEETVCYLQDWLFKEISLKLGICGGFKRGGKK